MSSFLQSCSGLCSYLMSLSPDDKSVNFITKIQNKNAGPQYALAGRLPSYPAFLSGGPETH